MCTICKVAGEGDQNAHNKSELGDDANPLLTQLATIALLQSRVLKITAIISALISGLFLKYSLYGRSSPPTHILSFENIPTTSQYLQCNAVKNKRTPLRIFTVYIIALGMPLKIMWLHNEISDYNATFQLQITIFHVRLANDNPSKIPLGEIYSRKSIYLIRER